MTSNAETVSHRLRAKPLPAAEELLAEINRIFSYDMETGLLTWRVRQGIAKPGDAAGIYPANGYPNVRILRHRLKIHQVAWLICYGKLPNGVIDHIDRDKRNNRIKNLREATFSENALNCDRFDHRNQGVTGATWSKYSWISRISVDGRRVYLGRFPTAEAANAAYVAAEKKLRAGELIG